MGGVMGRSYHARFFCSGRARSGVPVLGGLARRELARILGRVRLSRRLLDDNERRDLLAGRGAEVAEAPRRGQHARFHRSHEGVVRVDGAAECRPDRVEVAGQGAQAIVELAAELADALGVGRDLLLPPSVRDGAQQRDQGRRRRDNDLAGHAVLDERGVRLSRRADKRLARDEHHDELRRGRELLPVRLGRERAHVIADLAGVAGHRALALVLGRGAHRLEVRGERNLRVDDDRAPTRQVGGHVGALATAFGLDGHLPDVVAVLGHPGQLDHAVQGYLAPPAPYLWRAERVDEVAGLALELLAQTRQPLDLALEAAVRLVARLLQATDPALVALERAPERCQARVDLLLPLPQPLLRELQELAVARAERLVAQRLERLLEAHPRLVEDSSLLVEALLHLVKPRVRVRALAPLGRDLPPHALELGALLTELPPELVPARLELGDPDVARAPLGVAAGGEVRGGGDPRDTSAEEERDDHERGLKHGVSPASVGRPP